MGVDLLRIQFRRSTRATTHGPWDTSGSIVLELVATTEQMMPAECDDSGRGVDEFGF